MLLKKSDLVRAFWVAAARTAFLYLLILMTGFVWYGFYGVLILLYLPEYLADVDAPRGMRWLEPYMFGLVVFADTFVFMLLLQMLGRFLLDRPQRPKVGDRRNEK